MTELFANRYLRSDAKLGSGGMGDVYAATDQKLGRRVAMKFLAQGWDADHLARFQREVQILSSLQHPNIITIFDAHVGAGEEAPYVVMELLEGRTLADVMDETPRVEASRVARVGAQLAAALEAAHAAGVIHRDVKPSNVMLCHSEGLGEVAKLLDFGIARDGKQSALTATGAVIGTPLYMSPEQALALPLGTASDIYSLGATMYHALTGEPPFRGEHLAALAVRIAGPGEATLTPEYFQGATAHLSTVILECIAKDPTRRPRSAHALRMRLEEAAAALTAGAGALAPTKDSAVPPTGALPPRAEPAPPQPPRDTGGPEGSGSVPLWLGLGALVTGVIATAAFIAGSRTSAPAASVTPPPSTGMEATGPTAASPQPPPRQTDLVAAIYEAAFSPVSCLRLESDEAYCWSDQDTRPALLPGSEWRTGSYGVVAMALTGTSDVLFETRAGTVGVWRTQSAHANGVALPGIRAGGVVAMWSRKGHLLGCVGSGVCLLRVSSTSVVYTRISRDALVRIVHPDAAEPIAEDGWRELPEARSHSHFSHIALHASDQSLFLAGGQVYAAALEPDTSNVEFRPLQGLDGVAALAVLPGSPKLGFATIQRTETSPPERLRVEPRTSGDPPYVAKSSYSVQPAARATPDGCTIVEPMRSRLRCTGWLQKVAADAPSPPPGETIGYVQTTSDGALVPTAGNITSAICVTYVGKGLRVSCAKHAPNLPWSTTAAF